MAGRFLLTRMSKKGLIGGAGFYVECPPRNQWDGITQCYAIAAFRELARLSGCTDWNLAAEDLATIFRRSFWCGDHFAEYVHPERGVVDRLSDVNFAAIGLGVATDKEAKTVWERLRGERSFWIGGMPTQLVSQPAKYDEWEFPEPLPFVHANGPVYDVAAMGRVWWLDALASARMNDWPRVIDSVRQVCLTGERDGWQWRERYHAQADGTVRAAGPRGYCEYAAILVRIVLGNIERFA